jgi:hypothetical protein
MNVKKSCRDYPVSDVTTDMAARLNGTVSSADWSSGCGDEFQMCRDLVVEIGFGPNSMIFQSRD